MRVTIGLDCGKCVVGVLVAGPGTILQFCDGVIHGRRGLRLFVGADLVLGRMAPGAIWLVASIALMRCPGYQFIVPDVA